MHRCNQPVVYIFLVRPNVVVVIFVSRCAQSSDIDRIHFKPLPAIYYSNHKWLALFFIYSSSLLLLLLHSKRDCWCASGRKINSIKNHKSKKKNEIALNQGYWTCILTSTFILSYCVFIVVIKLSPNKVKWKLSLKNACKSPLANRIVWVRRLEVFYAYE